MARIAFVVDDLFEDSELAVPLERVRGAGHEAVLVGLERGKKVTGKRGEVSVAIERAAGECAAEDFDAIVVPGGLSPDRLRTSLEVVRLVRAVYDAGKPVAAVCHGPWLLVEAEAIDGRTVTSWPSLRTDLVNAGARWVDRPVVEDDNVITSRRPDDLDAFSAALLRQIERGRDTARARANGRSPEQPPAT